VRGIISLDLHGPTRGPEDRGPRAYPIRARGRVGGGGSGPRSKIGRQGACRRSRRGRVSLRVISRQGQEKSREERGSGRELRALKRRSATLAGN
jgi:hypothetical protein